MKKIILLWIVVFSFALFDVRAESGTVCIFPLDLASIEHSVSFSNTNEVIRLCYDSSWIGGDESANVVIRDNDKVVAEVSGKGEIVWQPTFEEGHHLTYTIYLNGFAQDEVYMCEPIYVNESMFGIVGLQRFTLTGGLSPFPLQVGYSPMVTLSGAGIYDATCPTYTTFVYSGFMHFKGGETYTFKAYYDDAVAVTVSGKQVIPFCRSCDFIITGSIAFEKSGWYPVEFHVSNQGGPSGPCEYVGIQYQTSTDSIWRDLVYDSAGTLLRTGPNWLDQPKILSAQMRTTDPTVMDVTYQLCARKPQKIRALAFQDGVRSFAKVVRPETFIDGTEMNIGDGIDANEPTRLAWKVSADWAIDLAQVKFEVLTKSADLLPLCLRTIPALDGNSAMEVSWNSISNEQIFDALLWQYADHATDLTLVNGVLKNGSIQLANGTSINRANALRYLYGKMGFSLLSGSELTHANKWTRLGLSSDSFAYRWITK